MPNDIYLSSTLNDLAAERAAARAVLGSHGFGIKDSYQASENSLIASCLDDVGQCAIYVCIIGKRYGYVPGGSPIHPNPDKKSITQQEFDQAQRLNLPCFVFVKSESKGYDDISILDAETGENDAGSRIRVFREWVSKQAQIRPAVFESIAELREKLLAAILSYQHKKAGAPPPILSSDTRHPAELTADIGLVLHPSADQETFSPYRQHIALDTQDQRFSVIDLAPDDPLYLARLDRFARHCRTLCWVLTPSVIKSYQDNPGVLDRAIGDQSRRRGEVGALLAGGASMATLPVQWVFGPVLEADTLPTVALNDAHVALRARVPSIRLDRRIAVPCLVFAMTRSQAEEFIADASVMNAVADPVERALRTAQLNTMLNALKRPGAQPDWPAGTYGAEGQDWRPYGPDTPTAREYIEQAAQRINEGEPSKRERLFIKGGSGDKRVRLQMMPYALDEAIKDFRGSQDAVVSVRDSGCLVLVDEMALLHPALRPWAKKLLRGENVAVLCSQPADPPPFTATAMLANDSSLQVGSLVTRFRDEHDPRCEVAINSPQRLQRWLRLVLPELVPTLGGEEVQTALANRSDEELFGKKVQV